MPCSNSDEDFPKDFNYDLWKKFATDKKAERRKFAVSNIQSLCIKLPYKYGINQLSESSINIESEFEGVHSSKVSNAYVLEDDFAEFFDIIQDLLNDDEPFIQTICIDQVRLLFVEFAKSQLAQHLKLRLSAHIVNTYWRLSEPSQISPLSDASRQARGTAVKTIQRLLRENLLSEDCIRNMVVPAVFERLSGFIEDVSLATEDIEANLMIISDVIDIYCSDSSAFSKEFIHDYVVPSFIAIIKGPSQLYRVKEIKKIFASSLARLSFLVGTEQTDMDLVPIFMRFLQVDSVDVHYSLLRNLSNFFKVLSDATRIQLAGELKNLMPVENDSKSWRVRSEMAVQLSHIVDLFGVEQIDAFFTPFALTFSADRIAVVRNAGILLLAEILSEFIQYEWKEKEVEKKEVFICDDSRKPLCDNELFEKITTSTEDEENYDEGEDRVIFKKEDGDSFSSSPKKCFDVNGLLRNPSATTIVEQSLPLTNRLLTEIRAGFLNTRCWRRRQSFARLLYTLVGSELIKRDHGAKFCHIFRSDILRVSIDDIANIRQYFCLVMQHLLILKPLMKNVLNVDNTSIFRRRLDEIAFEDNDMEVRQQALIALGEIELSSAELDLKGRKERLELATEAICKYLPKAHNKSLQKKLD